MSILSGIKSFVKRKTSQKYKFNQQYSGNVWDGLNDVNELARYSVITGYIRHYCTAPSILDLGCGEGILQKKLTGVNYSRFMGIDFSDVAIANAQSLADERTAFSVGDLNNLSLESKYDAIVYNESIYYLSNPAQCVATLFSHLNEGGVFIFSIVDKHGKVQNNYWQQLDKLLDFQDSTQVFNKLGHSWTIKVYKVKE